MTTRDTKQTRVTQLQGDGGHSRG